MLKELNLKNIKSLTDNKYKSYNLFYESHEVPRGAIITPFITRKDIFSIRGVADVKSSLINIIYYFISNKPNNYSDCYVLKNYDLYFLKKILTSRPLDFRIKSCGVNDFKYSLSFVSDHKVLEFQGLESNTISSSYSIAECLFAGLTYEQINPNLISQIGYVIR